ncbi:MAG: winged helix-turn-helix domain-containing protein [Acidobacteria bacterium]|nr:winged helix-turn-helix domain-containing protein [Acidobacteriota bacterium]
MTPESNDIILFGSFEFNRVTHTLVREKKPVSLRSPSARLLSLLLSHPKEILTKEQLIKEIWPDTTVTESALTQSVKDLRKALHDSVANSVYIKTHSGRGYQWVFESVPASPQIRKHTQASKIFWGALVALLLLSWLTFYYVERRKANDIATLQQPYRVVVYPFRNSSEDSKLDWVELGLSDMVRRSCQSRFPWPVVFAPMDDKGPPSSGATLSVFGVLLSQANQFRLDYEIVASTGDALRGSFLSRNATDFADLIAELIGQNYGHDNAPKELSWSKDPEANKDYARAIQAFELSGAALAEPYLEAALVRDPDFVWARVQMVRAAYQLGDWRRAEQSIAALQDRPLNLAAQVELACISASINARRGLFVEAKKDVDHMWHQVEGTSNAALKLAVLSQEIDISLRRGDLRQSDEATLRWNQMGDSFSTLELQGDSLYLLGTRQLALLSRAHRLEALKLAADMFRRLGLRTKLARALVQLGAHDGLPLDVRQESLNEAVEVLRELNHRPDLAAALSMLGYFHALAGHHDDASTELSQAADLCASIGAMSTLAKIEFFKAINQVSRQYAQGLSGANESTWRLFSDVLDQFEGQGAMAGMFDCLLMMTLIDLETAQTARAQVTLDRVEKLGKALGDSLSTAYIKLVRGCVLEAQGSYDEAIDAWDGIDHDVGLAFALGQFCALKVDCRLGSTNSRARRMKLLEQTKFPPNMNAVIKTYVDRVRTWEESTATRDKPGAPSLLWLYFSPDPAVASSTF